MDPFPRQFYAPSFLVSVKSLPFLEHAARVWRGTQSTHPHSKIALDLQNISAVAARPDKRERRAVAVMQLPRNEIAESAGQNLKPPSSHFKNPSFGWTSD